MRTLILARDIIAFLAVVLVVSPPAVAKCCSLGGGASYDFLGDPAMDIGIESYDQFLSEQPAVSVAAVPDVKEAAESKINLNLSDNSSIYLLLTMAEGDILGKGNITSGNTIGSAEAVGMLQGNKLYLDVAGPGKKVYKFSLAAEGSSILGDCNLFLPDGKQLNLTTEGKWKI